MDPATVSMVVSVVSLAAAGWAHYRLSKPATQRVGGTSLDDLANLINGLTAPAPQPASPVAPAPVAPVAPAPVAPAPVAPAKPVSSASLSLVITDMDQLLMILKALQTAQGSK